MSQRKFDRRWVIAFGFLVTTFGLYYSTTIYLGASFRDMLWLRVLQVLGVPFIFVEINRPIFLLTPLRAEAEKGDSSPVGIFIPNLTPM